MNLKLLREIKRLFKFSHSPQTPVWPEYYINCEFERHKLLLMIQLFYSPEDHKIPDSS